MGPAPTGPAERRTSHKAEAVWHARDCGGWGDERVGRAWKQADLKGLLTIITGSLDDLDDDDDSDGAEQGGHGGSRLP